MKKTVTILISILAVSMMVMAVAPVMAIGPWKALDKNPLLTMDGTILNLETANGVTARWHPPGVTDLNPYRSRDLSLYRPASITDVNGELKNVALALIVWDGPVWTGSDAAYKTKLGSWILTWIFTKLASKTSSTLAFEYENKWIYMSSDYVRGMWFLGYYQQKMPIQDAQNLADYFADVLWPNGVYFKYNNVGQLGQ